MSDVVWDEDTKPLMACLLIALFAALVLSPLIRRLVEGGPTSMAARLTPARIMACAGFLFVLLIVAPNFPVALLSQIRPETALLLGLAVGLLVPFALAVAQVWGIAGSPRRAVRTVRSAIDRSLLIRRGYRAARLLLLAPEGADAPSARLYAHA